MTVLVEDLISVDVSTMHMLEYFLQYVESPSCA